MYALSNYGSPFAVITEEGYTKQKIKKAIEEEFIYKWVMIDLSFTLPDWGETKVLDFVANAEDLEEIEDNISVIKLISY